MKFTDVIIRPFPPDLNHEKVDSLIETLKVRKLKHLAKNIIKMLLCFRNLLELKKYLLLIFYG